MLQRRRSSLPRRRRTAASANLQALEKRELLAGDLVSVSADVTEQFDLTAGSINELTTPPRELTFRFTGPVDLERVSQFRFEAAGGNGAFDPPTAGPDGVVGNEDDLFPDEFEPGFLGYGENNSIVVARFAGDLDDDSYRVTVPPRNAEDATEVLFDLEIGSRVVAVVPQPITFSGSNRSQAGNQIEVFFEGDALDPASAANVANYRLFETNGSVEGNDDTELAVTGVAYDAARNVATLTVPALLNSTGIYRLRIGSPSGAPAPPTPVDASAETGDTFGDALAAPSILDTADGVTSVVFTGAAIRSESDGYVLPWPGAYQNPGVRDDQRRDSKFTRAPDTTTGVNLYPYNFADLFGTDAQGNLLDNAITQAQRQRVREVLDLYESVLGVRFIETEDSGLQFVTGDIRGVQQTAEVSAGRGTPTSLFRIDTRDPSRAVLVFDGAENFFDGYGLAPDSRISFFVEAIRGVGNVLGIGDLFELPTGTDGAVGGDDEPNSELFSDDGSLSPGGTGGGGVGFPDVRPEADFLSQAARAIGRAVNRPEIDDVDFYEFTVAGDGGTVRLETYAGRLAESSLLDSALRVFRVAPSTTPGGPPVYTLVGRNDDSFGEDAALNLQLDAGTYVVGVSASGHESYTGLDGDVSTGGRSEGRYDLRITLDGRAATGGLTDVDGTLLDGDADGIAGGNFNFWFRTAPDNLSADPRTIYVDRDASIAGSDGTLARPLTRIDLAADAARPGDIIRVLPSRGDDGDVATPDDGRSYNIGVGGPGGGVLRDGANLEIPRGVTVMIDAGSLLKFRDSKITVGSGSDGDDRSLAALQVLGTPEANVIMTSLEDESIGVDPLPGIPQNAAAGDWGGLEFRGDFDRATGRRRYDEEGIFIDYVAGTEFRFGGGRVAGDEPTAPVTMIDARPTIIENTMINNALAAMAATPDTFEETRFDAPRYQRFAADAGDYAFTVGYDRVGPEIYGNQTLNNTINGLLIRVDTPTAGVLDTLDVSARFDDTDIAHVVSDSLIVAGRPGGPILSEARPSVGPVTASPVAGGSLAAGTEYQYVVTFVTAGGQESLPSRATDIPTTTTSAGAIRLTNLPQVPEGFVARNLYRGTVDGGGAVTFALAAVLDGQTTSYTDDGTTRAPNGTGGGTPPVETLPSAGGVMVTPQDEASSTNPLDAQDIENVGGTFPAGTTVEYRFTFTDDVGGETDASESTMSAVALQDGQFRLTNIPVAPSPRFVATNVYRRINGSGRYVLVAELTRGETTFYDTGRLPGLNESSLGRPLDAAGGGSRLITRPDARLTIDPGMVVKFDTSRIEVNFGADLYAEADETNPIFFTSVSDDTVGGTSFDTDNSGASSGSVGDWGGLSIRQGSTASLENVGVRFGGGQSVYEGGLRTTNPLEILQADVRVVNSTFEDNADGFDGNRGVGEPRLGRGANVPATIFVRGAQPILVGNVLDRGEGAAISINPDSLTADANIDHGRSTGDVRLLGIRAGNQGPLIADNQIGNHAVNGLDIRSEIVTVDSTWDDTDITHVVRDPVYSLTQAYGGSIRLRSSESGSLVVKFAPSGELIAAGRPLDISDRVGGTLQVVGSENRPVILTSLTDDTVGAGFTPDGDANLITVPREVDADGDEIPRTASAGDWVGLTIDAYANDANVGFRFETETDLAADAGRNATPGNAEFIGSIASDVLSGDENERLGSIVRGTLSTAADVDTYQITAAGGTELTIDVDETSAALDSVVELVSMDGTVLARSDNSRAESVGTENLFVATGVTGALPPEFVRPMATSIYGGNVESPNAGDAGMRIRLPGAIGVDRDYFVRVRTAAAVAADAPGVSIPNTAAGGQYTLKIRLDGDEVLAGSTVRRADIRFATTAIAVTSTPTSSPLSGTSRERVRVVDNGNGPVVRESDNNRLNVNFATAQPLGNLNTSDRARLRVTGELGNIDNLSIPTAYESLIDERLEDIDIYRVDLFAQQLEPDVFDNENRYVTATFDIDFADQLGRPNTFLSVFDSEGRLILVSQDSNVADDQTGVNLEGGSSGVADSFIGPVELPEGTYFVAVSNAAVVPAAYSQFFDDDGAPADDARVFPLNAVRTVSFDSFTEELTTGFGRRLTDRSAERPVIEPNFDSFSAVPYDLADVYLFANYNIGLTGDNDAILTQFNPFTGEMIRLAGERDDPTNTLAIREDGELFAFKSGVDPGEDLTAGSIGQYQNINPTNGAQSGLSDDGVTFIRTNDNGDGTEADTDPDAIFFAQGATFERAPTGPQQFNTNPIPDSARGWVIGNRVGDGRNEVPDGLQRNILFLFQSTTGEITSFGSTNGDDDIEYPDGSPYQTDFGPGASEGTFGVVDTGQLDPNSGRDNFITGIAYLNNNLITEEIVAVTNDGGIYTFDPRGGVGGGVGTFGVIPTSFFGTLDPAPGHDPLAGVPTFTDITAGPQIIQNAEYADTFFATTDDNWLYAFRLGQDGGGRNVAQPANVFANGSYGIPLTFVDGTPVSISGPSGLAFSVLEINPWHVTTDRFGDVDGGGWAHGINTPYDLSRQPSTAGGGASLYFGFELEAINFPTGPTTNRLARPDGDNLGQVSPGGSHGSVISDPIDLSEYSSGDQPTLYFTYHVDGEDADDYEFPGTPARDALRVYGAGDDGTWRLLATTNDERELARNDEFDYFFSPERGGIPVQEVLDDATTGQVWRQSRVDLSPLAGSRNVQIRFDFSTAGSQTTQFGSVELVALDGDQIASAVLNADDDASITSVVFADPASGPVAFTFDTIVGAELTVAPGAVVADGDAFTLVDDRGGRTTVVFGTGTGVADEIVVPFTAGVAPAGAAGIGAAIAEALSEDFRVVNRGNGRVAIADGASIEVAADGPAIAQSTPRTPQYDVVVPSGADLEDGQFANLLDSSGNPTFVLFVEADGPNVGQFANVPTVLEVVYEATMTAEEVAAATEAASEVRGRSALANTGLPPRFAANGDTLTVLDGGVLSNQGTLTGPDPPANPLVQVAGVTSYDLGRTVLVTPVPGDAVEGEQVRVTIGGVSEVFTYTATVDPLTADSEFQFGGLAPVGPAGQNDMANEVAQTVNAAFGRPVAFVVDGDVQFTEPAVVETAGTGGGLDVGEADIDVVINPAGTRSSYLTIDAAAIGDDDSFTLDAGGTTYEVVFDRDGAPVFAGVGTPVMVAVNAGDDSETVRDALAVALASAAPPVDVIPVGSASIRIGGSATSASLGVVENPSAAPLELNFRRGDDIVDNSIIKIDVGDDQFEFLFDADGDQTGVPDPPNGVQRFVVPYNVGDAGIPDDGTPPEGIRNAFGFFARIAGLEVSSDPDAPTAVVSALDVDGGGVLQAGSPSVHQFAEVISPTGAELADGDRLDVSLEDAEGNLTAVELVFVRVGSTLDIGLDAVAVFFDETTTADEISDRIVAALSTRFFNAIAGRTAAGVFVAADGSTASMSVSRIGINTAVAQTQARGGLRIPLTVPAVAAGSDVDGDRLTFFALDEPGDSGLTVEFDSDGAVDMTDPADIVVDVAAVTNSAELLTALLEALPGELRGSVDGPRGAVFANVAGIETDGDFISYTAPVDTSINPDRDTRAIPILVRYDAEEARVADSVRAALRLGPTSLVASTPGDMLDVTPTSDDPNVYRTIGGNRIRLYDLSVIDAGPYGLNRSIPSIYGSAEGHALPGDDFGYGGSELQGPEELFPTLLSDVLVSTTMAANNDNVEGVYIDDIVIGFAERGESVHYGDYLDEAPNATFVINPEFVPDSRADAVQPENPDEVLVGLYTLDIRLGDSYGVPQDYDPINLRLDENTAAGRSFDSNDRLTDGSVSLYLPNGLDLTDGDTLTIDDGARTLTFEFDNSIVADGVADGNELIAFAPIDSAADIAAAVRDAINANPFDPAGGTAGGLSVTALTGDGRSAGVSTSTRVDLFGDDIFVNPGSVDAGDDDPQRLIRIDGYAAETPFGDFTTRRTAVVNQDTREVVYANYGTGPATTTDFVATAVPGGTVGDALVVRGKIGDQVAKGIPNNISADDGAILASDPRQDIDTYRIYLTGGASIDLDIDTAPLFRDGVPFANPVLSVLPADTIVGLNPDIDGGSADQTDYYRALSDGGFMTSTLFMDNARGVGERFDGASLTFTAPADGYYDVVVASPVAFGFDADDDSDALPFDYSDFGDYQLTVRPSATTGVPARDVIDVAYFFGRTDAIDAVPQGQLIIERNQIRDAAAFAIDASASSRVTRLGSTAASQPILSLGVDANPAAVDLPATGVAANLRGVNDAGLLPGVVILNNLIVDSEPEEGAADGDDSTGIRIGGDVTADGVVPSASAYARVFNNTIVGDGNGTGIAVVGNASPTILNNVLVNLAVGLDVADTAETTVADGNTYAGIDASSASTLPLGQTSAIINDDPDTVDDEVAALFINVGPDGDIPTYIPADDSPLIDSSIGSLPDRSDFLDTVKEPLGIGPSPIVAPLLDALGNRRVDTPGTPNLGTGGNAFVDRGALENFDNTQPTARLIQPLDAVGLITGSGDVDPASAVVRLEEDLSLPAFTVLLSDVGVGINDRDIVSETGALLPGVITLRENGRVLTLGTDFNAAYSPTTSTIQFTSTRGEFLRDAIYEIDLRSITDLAGNRLQATNNANQTRLTIITAGVDFDFGDAPASYDAGNRAAHAVGDVVGLRLGTNPIDSEPNPASDADAAGDDAAGIDDEDAFTTGVFNDGTSDYVVIGTPDASGNIAAGNAQAALFVGGTTLIPIAVDGPDDDAGNFVGGFLDGWIDYNANGSFEPNEQFVGAGDAPFAVTRGINLVSVAVPATATASPSGSPTFMRLRISDSGGLEPGGVTIGGEVEDHPISIAPADLGLPVNNPPTFDAPAAVTLDEDAQNGTPVFEDVVTGLLPDDANNLVNNATQSVSLTAVFDDPGNGLATDLVLTDNGDGTADIGFTLTPDAAGSFDVVVTAMDDSGDAATDTFSRTVTFVITPVNDPPTVNDRPPIQGTEDVAIDVSVATLQAYFSPGPANESTQSIEIDFDNFPTQTDRGGTLTVNRDASGDVTGVTYTPPADRNSNFSDTEPTDTFSFSASDSGTPPASATATVAFELTPVDDRPTPPIVGNVPNVLEDAATQVVNNFATGLQPGPATALDELAAGAGNFTVTLTPTFPTGGRFEDFFSVAPTVDADSGRLTYRAAPDAYGAFTFDLVVDDGTAQSAPVPVTINVLPVNDAPRAAGPIDIPGAREDESLQFPLSTILAGVRPGPAIDALTPMVDPTDESDQTLTLVSNDPITTASGGTVEFVAGPGGSTQVQYTPPAEFSGPDSFLVSFADDGPSGVASSGTLFTDRRTGSVQVSLDVEEVNDPPIFVISGDFFRNEDDDAPFVDFATGIAAGPIGSGESASQTVDFTITPQPGGTAGLFVSGPTLVQSGDGTADLVFELGQDRSGSTTFDVVARDSEGAESLRRTFTITVGDVSDPPTFTLVTDTVSVDEDSGASSVPVATEISPGAADETDETISFTVTVVDPNDDAAFVSGPAIDGNGVLTFTLADDVNTTDDDPIVLRVVAQDDGGGVGEPETLTLNISPVADAPVAFDDTIPAASAAAVDEDAAFVFDSAILLANDFDADGPGDPLQVVFAGGNTITSAAGAVVSIDGNGLITYDPTSAATIQALGAGESFTDTFTYTALDSGDGSGDGRLASSPATVSVRIVGAGDAPVAVDDQAFLRPGVDNLIDVLDNDRVVDRTAELLPGSVVVTFRPAFGSATANSDGTITYRPVVGSTVDDFFEYTVTDTAGQVSDPARVRISANPAPIAVADNAFTTAGTPVTIDVLANDFDPGRFAGDPPGAVDPGSLRIVSGPARGLVTVDNGTVVYTPPAEGSIPEAFRETFVYAVSDLQGRESEPATVTVTTGNRLQNPIRVADVNNNGEVDPLDALLILNLLRRNRTTDMPVDDVIADIPADLTGQRFYNVDGDDDVDTLDALAVLNALRRQNAGGSGESLVGNDAAFAETVGPRKIAAIEPIGDVDEEDVTARDAAITLW